MLARSAPYWEQLALRTLPGQGALDAVAAALVLVPSRRAWAVEGRCRRRDRGGRHRGGGGGGGGGD
jgi:hypothetical protein